MKVILMNETSNYLNRLGRDYVYDPDITIMVQKDKYFIFTNKIIKEDDKKID